VTDLSSVTVATNWAYEARTQGSITAFMAQNWQNWTQQLMQNMLLIY